MVSRIRSFLHPTADMRRAAEEVRMKAADACERHEENARAISENEKDIDRLKHEDRDTRWRRGA